MAPQVEAKTSSTFSVDERNADGGQSCFSPGERQVSAESCLSKIDNLVLGQQRMEWSLAELRRDVQGMAAVLASTGSAISRSATPAPNAFYASDLPVDFLRGQASCLESRSSLVHPIDIRRSSKTSVNSLDHFDEESPVNESPPPAAEDAQTALQVAPSLPLCWPASLCMRQGPDIELPRSSVTFSSRDLPLDEMNASEGSIGRSRSSRLSLVSGDSSGHNGCRRCHKRFRLRHWMISPSSNLHAAYTIINFMMLMYDLVLTPYVVAWEIELDGFFEASAWMSCIFWSADIVVSFLTGYTESDRLEMRPWRVAVHFAKTWFLPDMTFVTCDWTALLLGYHLERDGSSNSLRVVRFAKLGKMLRVMGIFRMMKVARAMDEFMETSSAFLRVLLRCFLLFVATMWLNHLVGCAWFAVGKMAPADTGLRWTDYSRSVEGVEHIFLDSSRAYQYVTSVHWSVAQFTLGAIEIGCSNTFERLFNIACLMLGLLFGSTLVSILSATMVEYQMMKQDQTQKLRKLRRFLRENSVNPGVSLLVQQQAAERLQFVDRIQEKDVKVLDLLSKSLRTDLRFDIAQPHLCSHPLFRLWTVMDTSIVRSLCDEALEDVWLLPQDDLFVAGTSSDRTYYLVTGQLIYTQSPETSGVQKVKSTRVEKGKWLAEASLWSYWIHVGTTKADSSSQTMVLSSEKTTAVLRRNRDVREITLEYRRHFHRRIIMARPPEYNYPTDLEVPCTEFGDLVFSMDPEVQKAIGLIALDQLVKQTWHRRLRKNGTLWKLKEEIIKGKSCIMMDANGQIERVVSVVALHIEMMHGGILVELGHVEKGTTKATCQLPGAKLDHGELPSEALERVVARLHLQKDDITIIRTERQQQRKQSQEYGIETRYLRHVHFGMLDGQINLPVLVPNVPPSPATTARDPDVVPAELTALRVYVVKDGPKRLFYAWLQQPLFDHLRTPEGEAQLRTWMSSLAVSDMEDMEI